MTFRVGQKVCCIDDTEDLHYIPPGLDPASVSGGLDGLKKGEIYTIAATSEFFGAPVVFLTEIRRGRHGDGTEAGFHQNRFRPIVERKTDISVFRRMLLPQGVVA